ncbi:hypothetical protein M3Y96_00317500 [Aphelenchoides besseyi]|nr:hypothetical protein M3Y96_00317500 [Aphelenchoides besseyi]
MDLRPVLFALSMFCGNVLVSSDEGCLKQHDNDLEIDGSTCTELKPMNIKVKEKQLSFQFKFDSTTPLVPKPIKLEVGGCMIAGDVNYGYSPGYFAHADLGNPNFPVGLKASEDKITSIQKTLPGCKPVFTPEEDGSLIKISYDSKGKEVPGFKIVFKDSSFVETVEAAGDWSVRSWRLWVTISGGVLIVAIVAILIIGGGWWYKKLKNKLVTDELPVMSTVGTTTEKSTTIPKSKTEMKSQKFTNLAKLFKDNPWIENWHWPLKTYTTKDVEFLRKTLEGPDSQLKLEMMLIQDPLNMQSMTALQNWLQNNNAALQGTCSNAEMLRLEADNRLIMKVLDARETLCQRTRHD